MIVYLSGAHNDNFLEVAKNHEQLGVMSQPRSRVADVAHLYQHHAADNGCFSPSVPFDPELWATFLNNDIDKEHCLFAVVPDVVGDAVTTLKRFHEYKSIVQEASLPLAFVTQDGCSSALVPWDEIDAIFTGGSDEWKESVTACALTLEARQRNKHTHMGRVNGRYRVQLAKLIGCDSVDGTYLRFKPHGVGDILDWLTAAELVDTLESSTDIETLTREITKMAEQKKTRERFKGDLTLSGVAPEAPVRRGDIDLEQFRKLVQQSWDAKQQGSDSPAIGATIPAAAKTLTETRFRDAAKELGLGVSVTFVDAGTEKGNSLGLTSGQARIIVEAKEKRKSTKPANVGPVDQPAPAKQAAKANKGLPPVQGRKAS